MRYAISISAAGMFTLVSTRIGASWRGRAPIFTFAPRSASSRMRGERRRLIDVADLRQIPLDDVDAPRRSAEDRQRHGFRLCRPPCIFAFAVETEVKDFGARDARHGRRVEVKTEKEVRFAVVRGGRAVVEAHRTCRRRASGSRERRASFR